MNVPQTSTPAEGSLGRDLLYAARYYLGNRWVLVAVASIAVAIGLSFGGWGWLVAAGLAPILLTLLPCLVMCAFGVCAMCRSNKTQTAASSETAGSTTSSTALGVAKLGQPAVGGASCCHGGAAEAQAIQVKQFQSIEERTDTRT